MSSQDEAAFEKAKAHFLQSLGFMKAEQWAQAESELRKSLSIIPDRISSLTNLSTVLLKLGKFTEAEDLVSRILAMDPDNPEATLNQGLLFNENKEFEKALASYGQSIQFKPDCAEAWANRGDTIRNLGRYEDALPQYKHALELDNTLKQGIRGLLECHKHLKNYQGLFEIKDAYQSLIDEDYLSNELLGALYLELGDKESAFNSYTNARVISETARHENNRTEWPILASRLKHDLEQLTYVEERGTNTESGKKALAILKRSPTQASFSPARYKNEELLFAVSGYHNVPDIPFSGKALGENNYAEIENTFLTSKVRLVVIDGFLSADALSNLRRFCLEATVWKRSYDNGYVGSFMGTGFCSRVILAIAEELKLAMPNVIGSNALSEAWAFKYDQNMKGINLHADFARINTNFWITPDEACLDKTKGGLLIYDAPAPNDWSFYSYNSDQTKIQTYLRERDSKFIRVPYRSNRCVLFDSTYFHATDDLSFAEGYANRRINCTLLYGKEL